MANLASDPDIIIVDPAIATSGLATISYSKLPDEELWFRLGTTPWTMINENIATGQRGAPPLSKGKYTISLLPGDRYELGVFTPDHGPTTLDPLRQASLVVFCLLKKPAAQSLIMDTNELVGGTFYWNRILTSKPTNIVEIGVSERAPAFDQIGLPRLPERRGSILPSLFTTDHRSEFTPLFAGNHYFFTVIVVDVFGNWDQKVMQLDTLRRTVTIDFPEVIVNNDGDALSHGKAEFWFKILEDGRDVVEFNRPTADVDDWGKKGRPYSLAFPDGTPFHHVIGPKPAIKGHNSISVYIHGTEYHEWPEEDEKAVMPFRHSLNIPFGRFTETVNKEVFWVSCGTGGINDFDFDAKVVFSVSYSP